MRRYLQLRTGVLMTWAVFPMARIVSLLGACNARDPPLFAVIPALYKLTIPLSFQFEVRRTYACGFHRL